MTKDELKKLLTGRQNDEIVDTEILNCRPWIFAVDAEHESWCASVAAALEIDKEHIHISWQRSYRLQPESTQGGSSV